MKRIAIATFCFLALALALIARAQMGMDIFKRPTIAKAFHPVVGKGAVYETSSKTGGSGRTVEMAIVAQESADGKQGYWMQFAAMDDKEKAIGKALITPDDLQFHRMIVQAPGQGAVELPANMLARNRQQMNDNLSEWQSVGSETVTVPAGTFSCEHWKNTKGGNEAWTSDKVTPIGLVKESQSTSTMVLVKLLDNVPDRITGPVKQFDMQQMMQQMQQQRQHPNP